MNIVFDIDGTLANTEHRLHFIRPSPAACTCTWATDAPHRDWCDPACPTHEFKADYDMFYAACVADEPIGPMVRLARQLMRDDENHVEFWTGRPERIRHETLRWLAGHGIYALSSQLFMRANGDKQEDFELKEKWLAFTTHRPDLVFEDRKRVVEMYRSRGILVVQPAPGDY